MGCAYLAKPQHERAVCYLKQAVSLDASLEAEANPKIAEAHFRRGLELREAGEFEEARKEFDKAVSVDPSIQNSLSQFEPLPEQATEGPKQDQASSDQAAEHRRRGFAKLKRGIHTDAIYEFTAAIVQDPDCAEAYYGRGVAFLERGFPDTAMQDLNEAIRHEPKLADAYWHRGRARAVLGLQLFAIQDYTRAIRLNPTCAEAYLCRGMLYINRRDLDLARNDLNEAKQLDPRLTSRIEGYLACISNLDRHRRGGVEEATETSEQSLQIALHPTTRE
jgi:tetratricopeptide (TPR) repeat protein